MHSLQPFYFVRCGGECGMCRAAASSVVDHVVVAIPMDASQSQRTEGFSHLMPSRAAAVRVRCSLALQHLPPIRSEPFLFRDEDWTQEPDLQSPSVRQEHRRGDLVRDLAYGVALPTVDTRLSSRDKGGVQSTRDRDKRK